MAFNSLDYLKHGKYQFIFDLTTHDMNNLVTFVRNSSCKNDIINGFLDEAKYDLPRFCLDIIYDMEEYKNVVFKILDDRDNFNYFVSSISKMSKILYTTSWGKEFIFNKFDDIVIINNDFLPVILNYAFFNFDLNLEFIKKISMTSNLHVRYQIMKFIIINYIDKLYLIYDDITNYLTSYTNQEFEQITFMPELMDKKDISDLAITIYNSDLDKSVWIKIKNFILNNYTYNYLSSLLLQNNENKKDVLKEFTLDADRLFDTSLDYKIQIYKKYSDYISKEVMDRHTKYFRYFNIDGKIDTRLTHLMCYELYDELKKYIDKYLSLSKTDDYKFLGRGSTASCYKIGDYVFKLNNMKWSYEDVICPNLYLIIKNLEEHYIRNENGEVQAGIEVQKYLSRRDEITLEHVNRFKHDLAVLGYYVKDTLIDGVNGNNCMLLDSYKDADCLEPELLPQHFKDFPMVLIDRDLVFEIGKKNIKSLLRSRY